MREFIVDVMMDAKTFKDFASFDSLKRQRQWLRPLAFMLIFFVFSGMCFMRDVQTGEGALLGVVMLILGLGLPVVYFTSFFQSVKRQIKAFKLATPQFVYKVKVEEQNGVSVSNEKGEAATYGWDLIFGVWRAKEAFYIYILPTRAFILPFAQVEQLGEECDKLWQLVCEKLPSDKQHIIK